MSKKLGRALLILAAAALIVVDQITKRWAVAFLRDGGGMSVSVIPGLLEFRYLCCQFGDLLCKLGDLFQQLLHKFLRYIERHPDHPPSCFDAYIVSERMEKIQYFFLISCNFKGLLNSYKLTL